VIQKVAEMLEISPAQLIGDGNGVNEDKSQDWTNEQSAESF